MTKEAILSTLEDYAESYYAKGIDALMLVFDDSDNISIIGTGTDELCFGRASANELFLRNLGEATANRFEWDWVDIQIQRNMPLSL